MAETIVFEIDERPALAATARANEGPRGFEVTTAKALQASDDHWKRHASTIARIAQEAVQYSARMASGIEQIARSSASLAASAAAFAVATKAVAIHAAATDRLVDSYRVLRIALSPTPLTVFTVAAGAAVEGTIKLVLANERLIRTQSLLAARSVGSNATPGELSMALRDIQTLTLAGKIGGGQDLLGLGKTPEQLQALATQLSSLPDPLRRAQFAVREFGDNAEKGLSVLSDRMITNIDRGRELAAAFDGPVRNSLARLAEDIHRPADALHRFADELRFIEEKVRTGLLVGIAATSGTLRNVGNNVADAREREVQALREGAYPGYKFPTIDVDPEKALKNIMIAEHARLATPPVTIPYGQFKRAQSGAESYENSLASISGRLSAARERVATLSNTFQLNAGDASRQALIAPSLLTARREVSLLEPRERELEALTRFSTFEFTGIGSPRGAGSLIALGGGAFRGNTPHLLNPVGAQWSSLFATGLRSSAVLPGELQEIENTAAKQQIYFPWQSRHPVNIVTQVADEERRANIFRGEYAPQDPVGVDKAEALRQVGELGRTRGLHEQLTNIAAGDDMRQAISRTYEIRLKYANDVYQIERKTMGDTLAGYRQLEELDKARIDRTVRFAELNQRQIDGLKNVSSSLFNTLFTSPKNFGPQLGSTVRGAVLGPITSGLGDLASRAVSPLIFGADGTGGIARSMKNLFEGSRSNDPVVALDSNTQATLNSIEAERDLAASVRGLSRQITSMGMAGMGLPGGAPLFNLKRVVRVPYDASGGLPPWLGNIVSGGNAGAHHGTVGGFLKGLSSLRDGGTEFAKNIKDFFYNSGAIGDAGGPTAAWIGGIRGKLAGFGSSTFVAGLKQSFGIGATGIPGVGGAAGTTTTTFSDIATSQGAAALSMAIGLPLAQAGLLGNTRGSWTGIAMGTIGGALTGAGIGTMILPGVGTAIGAGIGAAVGFGVGLGEKLFGVEPQWQEAERLVRQQYQVSINRGLGQSIAVIANQNFRGHVSLAVSSPDVRRLIELYARSTGQPIALSASTPRSASLVEQAGILSQAPGFAFGQQYAFPSDLPVLGGYRPDLYPSSRTTAPDISSAPSGGSVEALINRVVNPSYIQAKFSAAQNQSEGRLSNAARWAQPGLVVQ